MAEEKRRYLRWRKKIRVAYAPDEENEPYREIFTEDLSEGGIQILDYKQLTLHQKVKLRLEFVYDSVPIVLGAEVVSVAASGNQYRMGLNFIEISEFEQQRLKRNLEKAKLDFRNEAK